jgi:hypothetical protein
MLTITQLAQMIERLAPHSIFPATPSELEEYAARLAQDAGGILFPEEGADEFRRELWLLVAKRVSELRQAQRRAADDDRAVRRRAAVAGLFQAAAAKVRAEKQGA